MRKRRSSSKNAGGFTFVETLVVVALAGVIGASLASSFMMGMRVWKRAAGPDLSRRKAILAIEKLSQDARSAFDYPAIGFFGQRDVLTLANIDQDRIWNITYAYAADDRAFYKTRTALGENGTKPQQLIPEVKDLSFSYYGYNNVTQAFEFQPAWNYTASGIPLAVRVEAVLENGYVFNKTISIPAGT